MRVGPIVKVNIKYECNGCEYLRLEEDTKVGGRDLPSGMGMKYHACHHPIVLKEYSCPQWFTGGSKDLTINHTAVTPKYLCPYIKGNE